VLARIKEQEKAEKRASQYACAEEAYKQLNIFDIGAVSTQQQNKNFNKEKFYQSCGLVKKEGYIEKYLDETNKSK